MNKQNISLLADVTFMMRALEISNVSCSFMDSDNNWLRYSASYLEDYVFDC